MAVTTKRPPKLDTSLDTLLRDIRACTVCAPMLPHAPRPVLAASTRARILIIGQAPGARVHASGVPWSDASGARLRTWLGVDDTTFYDASRFAIVPVGFCFPGRGASGDLPPRPECAGRWHRELLAQMRSVKLTLLIGQYAQRFGLGDAFGPTSTETLVRWAQFGPHVMPLPHPSPRNIAWFKRNAWFEGAVLPTLRQHVATVLAGGEL
ncbi:MULTISPECIES: uracil-DNA glycosylase family protein [unclassified Paraburkholderia]|uniref:uracil-DNA glycosylase family protein n=1 Tax=unclassified Paraburkholderia TaxID=2615204 RepID=UPI001607362F|nr:MULTISPECIES: uracil-DNA glycosylase family protein [unclassified Paraburkholderia]MBB5447963.1 uracil-DNA glycosylase [Paraburkholderia sp. WSM4177]MBB5488378.1 uracil-DNA glycosylase [Paraburkholderia sp. WSM4180]